MPLLETRDLTAYYGDFQALFGITTTLEPGETVAIIGANGAGKSTFLKSIAGLLPSRPDAVRFDGRDIGSTRSVDIVAMGIVLVPEGRRLFPSLSVEENLLVGGYRRRGKWTLDRVYALFPILAERRHLPATSLSGGQQQMCAIGRALMADPRVLLCDEVSLGLAPIVIDSMFETIVRLNREMGLTILLVEQNATLALEMCQRAYVLKTGQIAMEGSGKELLEDPRVRKTYLGITD